MQLMNSTRNQENTLLLRSDIDLRVCVFHADYILYNSSDTVYLD